ncbi:aspartic proteinase-like protein 2 [Prunus yedoensis var. nudiflora]|uniref:Aspartic proteinase-like protein 2 n=1 Tax=Prunus yedoensis var. nudiflora TaxID=2094558 RepID=A0A314Z9U1_PRUYE|nr:aspartic proteinase-like protein 2 [Prunus yedoensis var. nudiflora]
MQGLKARILASFAVLSLVYCGVVSTFLSLERIYPPSHRVQIEQLRARDRVRHARLLQNVAGGVVDFPVQGYAEPNLAGLYYTKVKLGSPPKEFNVQIDTGSESLWVACNSCSDCPRSTWLPIQLSSYDSASSSTAQLIPCSMCTPAFQAKCSPQTNQCSYSIQYADGSGALGHYVSDTLHFDRIQGQSYVDSSASIIFGCTTYESVGLTSSIETLDGILGFSQGPLSVISQLSSRGLTPKVFSHCLKGDEKGGGTLALGEILEPSIVYSPLVPPRHHYYLNLQSIAVNGKILPIDPAAFTSHEGGTIIDSGTTLAYLVEEAYVPFVRAITSAVSPSLTPFISDGNQCFHVTTSLAEVFPTVNLNFVDASMVLKPEEYLTSIVGISAWCIGFQKAQGRVTILGDLVLKDKIIVYDLARQRIGWANYDCSSPVNVSIPANYAPHRSESRSSSGGLLLSVLTTGFVVMYLLA